MTRPRRLLLAFGLIASLLGVLLLTAPSLGAGFIPTGIGRTAPFALVGIAVVLLAGIYFLTDVLSTTSDERDDTEGQPSATPMPECRPDYESFDEPFAHRLDEISWTDRRETTPTSRLSLRDDLREMAVRVLADTEQWSRSEVESRLNTGAWTPDPDAAAFFTDDIIPELSLRQQLRSLWSPEAIFARRARHTIAALANRTTDTPVTPALRDKVTSGRSPSPPVSIREYWRASDETARERRAGRANGTIVAALALGGLGILTLTPSLLLLTLFGVVVAGYARVTTPPTETVSVSRVLDTETPTPGTAVSVTVTIENTGSATLADLRVIDGVPPGLRVTEASPRFTTALRPGKEASFTYTVEAVPGRHVFEPMLVITRDVTGLQRREALVEPTPTALTCQQPTRPAVTAGRRRTTRLPGVSRSNIAGAGVEFHSVREYRPGDPLSRVNWKQRAKTGEFTTIDFDESRLTRVLVAVDTRRETYRTVGRDADTPLVRGSIAAAHDVAMTFLDDQIPVGLLAVSPRSCWLAPHTGATHRDRIQTLLTENDAFSWTPPTANFDIEKALGVLTRQTQTATQIVVVSPLIDEQIVQFIRLLDAHSYTVSVHSPLPTEEGVSLSAGEGYAVLMRRFRINSLRNAGIHVQTEDTLESPGEAESS